MSDLVEKFREKLSLKTPEELEDAWNRAAEKADRMSEFAKENDVCDYCGVSYEKTHSSDKIVEVLYKAKFSQLSDFLNGNMKPFMPDFCGRPIWKTTKRL